MGEENHPNLQAVGLTVAIIMAIIKSRRGEYGKLPLPDGVFASVPGFVALVERKIDEQVAEQIAASKGEAT
jgi:hypothetical protein